MRSHAATTSVRQTHERRRGRARRAFTLIEAIATITVLATVMAVCANIVYSAVNQFNQAATRAEVSNKVNTAMERVLAELREIAMHPTNNPITPDITTITATTIFWPISGSSRSLELVGSNLILDASGTRTTLLDNCTTFTVLPLDKDGGSIAVAGPYTNVRRLQITITATQSGMTESLRTRVYLRNLMSGSGAP